MKLKHLAITAAIGVSLSASAMADDLTGDVKLACEAILCLSTGSPPNECRPSLQRYFSISFTFWSDTLRGRINFLNLCPASSQDDNMKALVDALANGAGRCDLATLNQPVYWGDSGTMIPNTFPSYCNAYYSNAYTDLAKIKPVYVGTPQWGGFWTTPDNYEAALAQYNAALAQRFNFTDNSGGG